MKKILKIAGLIFLMGGLLIGMPPAVNAYAEENDSTESDIVWDDPELDRHEKIAACSNADIAVFSESEKREIKAYGIDVSQHNGAIDWQKVKAAGVEFAFIRAGFRGYAKEGKLVTDSRVYENLKGAQEAGIQVGVYFFSTALDTEEAIEEANYTINIIKDYSISYPVVYDCEGYDDPDYRIYNLNKTQRTNNAIAFLDYIESQGYKGMMYSSSSHYVNQWETSRLDQKYDIWVAQYPYYSVAEDQYIQIPDFSVASEAETVYTGTYRIWQCSSEGYVDGIDTYVDLDIEYYDEGGSGSEETVGEEKEIDGKWYYIYEDGTVATGWTYHDGNWYYYEADGARVHGLYEIEGEYYYFHETTGVRLTGEKKINGRWYYFDGETGRRMTGFQTIPVSAGGTKTVYYGSDGAMCYGEQKVNGKWYYFHTSSGKMMTGFQTIPVSAGGTKTVYYGSDGAMRYGEQKVNGKWYYFHTSSGKMMTSFQTIPVSAGGTKTVYYGSDGAMRYGEQKVNGKWYYFHTSSGKMMTGFQTIPVVTGGTKTVYYGSDGAMCYGWQKINGEWYYFNESTGALQ